MRTFIAWTLKQSAPLNAFFFGVIIYAAAVSLPNISVERFPNFSFAQAQVVFEYPGASPGDIERLVTRPVEEAIRGLDDLEWAASTSVPGRSEVLVKFDDDTDYDTLFDRFRIRVLSIQNRLPHVNGKPLEPFFLEIDVDQWVPLIQVMLSRGSQGDLDDRALTLLATELQDRLERLEGIKRVDLAGISRQQFDIVLDPELLDRHGIALDEVLGALSSHNSTLPAGIVEGDVGELSIRIDTRPRSPDDLLAVAVRADGDGATVSVGDLIIPTETGVRVTEGRVRYSVDGKDAVGCRVLKDDLANSLDVRDRFLEEVEAFKADRADIPFDLHISMDSTKKLQDSLAVMHDSLLLAFVLVVTTLFFFLSGRGRGSSRVALLLSVISAMTVALSQDFLLEGMSVAALGIFVFFTCRSAVLTVSGIVFSFLGTLVAFQSVGQSINEVSLIGFVLTVGIIVDDAIIVLENIQRHREEGAPFDRAVVDGVYEVFWPVVSATLTTCAAFLPMLIMTGTVGDFFSILPISVATALAISICECLVLLPLHIVDLERLMGPESGARATGSLSESPVVRWFGKVYERILRWNVANSWRATGIVAGMFLLAILIVVQSAVGPSRGWRPILKYVFFPEDTSILNVAVRMPAGSGLEATDEVVREISEHLAGMGPGYFESSSAYTGLLIDTTYRPSWSHQYGFILAEFPVREKRAFDDPVATIAKVRKELVPQYRERGIQLEVTAQKDGPPTGSPLSIRVLGGAEESVRSLATEIYALLRREMAPGGDLEGIIDLSCDLDQQVRSLSFIPNPRAMSILDVDPMQVQRFVAGTFDGVFVGEYLRTDDEIPIKVRMPRESVEDPTRLLDIPILHLPGDRMVRFGELGLIESGSEPSLLRRRFFQRSIGIIGNFSVESTIDGGFVEDYVLAWYEQERGRFPGAAVDFGGEADQTMRSFRSLFIAFGLAIFLIYLILTAQFSNLLQPLSVLSNVIFSFTGVVLAMALFSLASDLAPAGWIRPERSYITLPSFIAVVGLTGIVVNDAIILVNFINRMRASGLSLDDAVIGAGMQRMRPILMTTISTIAGLIPMAIGIPHYAVKWTPFATAFVAGLLLSTTMTLLIVPILYRGLDIAQSRLEKRWQQRGRD